MGTNAKESERTVTRRFGRTVANMSRWNERQMPGQGWAAAEISDWPHHCHPQGYTQTEDDVIEQAYASQMSITRRVPSQVAHPL
jgi:hypothetical protein